MAKIRLGLCIWLCIKFICSVNCVRIQFYENQDFTGLYHESNSTSKCNNFPGNNSPFVKSIRTDTCLITYLDKNCKSTYSWKIIPPEISDGEYRLGSFHACNEDEGGNSLNVDITDYYDIWNPSESPKILESYKNVCSCVNIPKYIQLLDEWSINNHGNELLGYFDADCSNRKWEPKLLAAGQSLDSRKVYMHQMTDRRTNKRYGIQSFGPYKYSTYSQTTCNSTTGATREARADIPEVPGNIRHDFKEDLKNDGDRAIEYCKIDASFLKTMENGFRKQMEAYGDLLNKFSELEQKIEKSVENVKICNQNKIET